MNLSAIEGWETPRTSTDKATFSWDDDLKRVYWDLSLDETHLENEPRRFHFLNNPSPPTPPHKMKRKLSMGMSLPKKGNNAACL